MKSGWKSRTISDKALQARRGVATGADSAADTKSYFDLTESLADHRADADDALLLTAMFDGDDDISVEQINTQPFDFRTDEDVFAWVAAVLGKSPSARLIAKAILKEDWAIVTESLHNNGYHIDTDNHIITLDNYAMTATSLGHSAFFRNDLLLNMVRAMRDLWHENRFAATALEFGAEEVLLLERVRAADCDTFAVLVAWELRGEGFSDIWRHIIGTEEGDMALAFSHYLERDPRALFDGRALAQAFRVWHEDDQRVDACDHETLEMLDDLILSRDGESPFGDSVLTKDRIEDLSRLPGGVIYLEGLGGRIRRDPYFAGLNDPINQAHLFQIIYDLKVTRVNDVPFRNRDLAQKIFPHGEMRENWSDV
ncbi:MAG: hypothetical protein QF692_00325 [Alphaproteobacteria bacterium]|jgi:hypothetical protein|nr:hypothetical protein [Alphaproteobacteria bacterium]MDP7221692.1 hypothetical protein [Alphaproteobacteria bacterium]